MIYTIICIVCLLLNWLLNIHFELTCLLIPVVICKATFAKQSRKIFTYRFWENKDKHIQNMIDEYLAAILIAIDSLFFFGWVFDMILLVVVIFPVMRNSKNIIRQRWRQYSNRN